MPFQAWQTNISMESSCLGHLQLAPGPGNKLQRQSFKLSLNAFPLNRPTLDFFAAIRYVRKSN